MASRLDWVQEESITVSAPCTPCNSYREMIQSVAGPEWRIRSTLFFQSGHSGSNCSSNSGASSSYQSNNSGFSSSSWAWGLNSEADSSIQELRGIASQMVSDGYTQRMVQAFGTASSAPEFGCGSCQDPALEKWFFDLDVDWVLRSRNELGSITDKSALWLQDLVERWIQALTVITASIGELLTGYEFALNTTGNNQIAGVDETLAVARFCKASISSMLIFVDTVVHVLEGDKLQAVLHMYNCISSTSHDMCTMKLIYSEAQGTFNDIGRSLDTEGSRLTDDIFNTMMHVRRTLMKDDESWAFEIPLGGGDVHTNIRFLVDCIVWIRKSLASTKNSAQGHNTSKLRDLVDGTIAYTKDLLVRKSELCPDPSLRYMFLLNNSNFVAQVSEPWQSKDDELWYGHRLGLKLIPECEEYMGSYLEVSWGHVLSCISESNFPGQIRRWINTYSLVKFQSMFRKIYQAQRFWKVPDRRLRSLLRDTIIKRVISGYRDYLKKHPELEKHVIGGSNSPDVLEEMLGELFEG